MSTQGISVQELNSESSRGIHRIGSLMQCARLFGYCYLLEIEPVESSKPLELGTCVHKGIEMYHKGADWRAILMALPAERATYALEAISIIDRYIVRWPLKNEDKIVALETEYPLVLSDGEVLTRRIDRVVISNGKVCSYDIKTAGNIPRRLSQTALDITLITQDMVGRQQLAPNFGLPWGGAYLDLVSTAPVSTASLKKGREDFPRVPLTYSLELIQQAERSLIFWAREERAIVQEFQAGRLDPWQLEQSFQCYPRGYSCKYAPLCISGRAELSRYARRAMAQKGTTGGAL